MQDFSDHNIWRLLLTVGVRGLEAAFYNRKTRACVPYISRTWECPDADVLKRIEDAVYDDALLPDDYDTTILLRPKATLLVPPELVDTDDIDSIREALDAVDASDSKDVWYEDMGEALALYSTPDGVKGFLGRTFLTEDVHHLLHPFVEHFRVKASNEGGEKMWVHLGENYVDMAAFRDGRLLQATSWYCSPGADAAYFLLFAWRTLGLDPTQGEMNISGKEEYRREVMTLLRRHINYVSLTVNSTNVSEALATGISMSGALSLLHPVKEK